MALFKSTFVNKLDRKGRVSVPAPFRAALEGQVFHGVVLFRAQAHACLEGVSWSTMEELSARLDAYDFLSPQQDDLATSVFGEAAQLPLDVDGRIILPADLASFAGISADVAFVGLGRKFQIWAPDALEKRKEQARKEVRAKGLTLPKGGAA